MLKLNVENNSSSNNNNNNNKTTATTTTATAQKQNTHKFRRCGMNGKDPSSMTSMLLPESDLTVKTHLKIFISPYYAILT